MPRLLTATIESGASLSDVLDCRDGYIEKIYLPAAWTSATLTVQVCETADGTFEDVYTETTELSLTAADAGRCILVAPERLLGGCYVKLRSGTGASAVNQAAEREITVKIRALT